MNKIILMAMVCLVPLAGCQPREEAATQAGDNVTNQRKEASKKLVVQGVMLLEKKDLQGAVSSLEASIKVDPTDPDGYLLLAQILLKVDQYDKAVDLLDQAAKTFPDNGTVFYMLSVSNKMAGKKLPSVLAARRSFDIFKASNDAENAQKSAMLLEQVIAIPDAGATKAPVKK